MDVFLDEKFIEELIDREIERTIERVDEALAQRNKYMRKQQILWILEKIQKLSELKVEVRIAQAAIQRLMS